MKYNLDFTGVVNSVSLTLHSRGPVNLFFIYSKAFTAFLKWIRPQTKCSLVGISD